MRVRRDYFTEEEEEVRSEYTNDTDQRLTFIRSTGLQVVVSRCRQEVYYVCCRGNSQSRLAFSTLLYAVLTDVERISQLLNNYTNLFTLITRMRQAADHVCLVLKSTTAMAVQHAPEDVPENILTCRLCLDEAEEAIVSTCKHTFCRECIRQFLETAIEQSPKCPSCQSHLTIDLAQDAIESGNENAPRQGFLARIDPSTYRSSTKIEAL